jgi:hypothetical protein
MATKQRWIRRLVICLSGLFVIAPAPPRAEDARHFRFSDLYVKKGSWAETMLASRKALQEHEATESGFQPFVSGVMHQGDPAQRVSINIAGVDHLWLVVTGADDGVYQDHSVWGEADLAKADGTETMLSALEPISARVGWHSLLRDKDYTNRPLRIAGAEFEHGLFAHADSALCYALGGQYERFEAWIGISDTAFPKSGSAQFKVLDRGDAAPMLWERIAEDFPAETRAMQEDALGAHFLWLRAGADGEAPRADLEKSMLARALGELGEAGARLRADLEDLRRSETSGNNPRWLDLYAEVAELRARLRAARERLKEINLRSLRRAVEDLTADFPQRYARGKEFLERLPDYERRLAQLEKALVDGADGVRPGETWSEEIAQEIADEVRDIAAFQREALIANPLVSGRPILFVARPQYRPDHHNTETMFQTGEINTASFEGGGAMKAVDLAGGGKARTLIEVPEGIARDPDVHFDGERIIFSMRRNLAEDYHIWEIDAEGGNLRQLTSAEGVTDIDPLYLPDGDVVFSSTREPKYCMCNRHIMANLFRMEGDGANIYQIGKNTLHDAHGSLMPDGRILYDRWEYVDRNFGDAQGLWTVNPDGTNHAVYWGNNTDSPGAVLDGRVIPGAQRVLCVFSSCHDRPWGALAIVDRRLGVDGREPVIRTWPADAIERVGKGGFDAFTQVSPKYEDPYPLSDKYFLCSRMTGKSAPGPKGEQMGIYLVDVFGNEILLYAEADAGTGCFDPMPLGPRPHPPVVPSRRDLQNGEGRLYVVDVHQGTHMKGVKQGAAKFLRVVESPEKRFWTPPAWGGQGQHAPGMNWHDFGNKRILGAVPVEEDGSAYFCVPSDRFLYFQLLDENGMMIQSMRSGAIVQSGETTGCTGCHESRLASPPPARFAVLKAAQRPPSKLDGWLGPPRLFNYMTEVQPVFDRYCVRCHDYGKEAGKKLNLARDRTDTFNASYDELWRKKYIRAIGAGPAEIQPAYSWGSHASRLIEVVRTGHQNVELDRESLDRLITWIDINAPYYPYYASAYPDNLAGRSPLDNPQTDRLTQLTGVPFAQLAGADSSWGPQVSFDRPDLSPCLARIEDKNSPPYREALAIIQAGKDMLAKRPRADMEGFEACPTDQRREEKYAMRRRVELRNRQAIREGRKVYDDALPD